MKVEVCSRRKPYAFDHESRTIVHMEAQSVTVSYEFLRAWIRAHVASERWRAAHVKSQLDRSRDLIDILPTRSRSADEALLDIPFVDCNGTRDSDHTTIVPHVRYIGAGLPQRGQVALPPATRKGETDGQPP